MIKLTNITKVYETPNFNVVALSDINFEFDLGEVVVLLGKSGSGKSTLLNLIGGFDRNYAGTYEFNTIQMKEKNEREIDEIRKRHIGFIFQNYVLLDNLTVLQNVELSLKVIGVVQPSSRTHAAMHALALVGLRDHAHKYPYQLSGGQRQRVAIARAFVKNPDVIIADEPTAALDSRTSFETLTLLKDLCRNKLLIIATHNKSIVRDFASRVVELKSGYTIRNELITDFTKVRVDDLDLVIDKELQIENSVVERLMQVEANASIEMQNSVLKDLGIDITQFRENKSPQELVDQVEKRRLIKERMKNSSLQTRIHRFLKISDHFDGQKRYAFKSFLRHLPLHSFSAFIFVLFMVATLVGFNFVAEVFGGFNEKALYLRQMTNETFALRSEDTYQVPLEDVTMIDTMYEDYVANFSQTEMLSSDFLDPLLEDPYFQYQLHQDQMQFIIDYMATWEPDLPIGIYDNPTSIMAIQTNDELAFEGLNQTVQNIINLPYVMTGITRFISKDYPLTNPAAFNYVYVEPHETLLAPHLVEGSRFPLAADEVVLPISYLFSYNIFSSLDFIDEFGNQLNTIPSETIAEAFFHLPAEEQTIEIINSTIQVSLNDDGNYDFDVEPYTRVYKVVGFVNLNNNLNPFFEENELTMMMTGQFDEFSLLVSNLARENLSYHLVDLTPDQRLYKPYQYVEVRREDYELGLNEALKTYTENYILETKQHIADTMEVWYSALHQASEVVQDFIADDLAGLQANPTTLNAPIDETLFGSFSYRDFLYTYMAQHLSIITSPNELSFLCNACSINEENFDALLTRAPEAYQKQLLIEEQRPVLIHFGDLERLTYQETTNRIIYLQFASQFNSHFKASSLQEEVVLQNNLTFIRHESEIESLLYLVVPRSFINSFSELNQLVQIIQSIDQSPGFQAFLEITSLDLFLYSVSTNALRSIILVELFGIIYLILFISILLLALVMVSLYSNIYETSALNRQKELASLRVMGTSYDDILHMVQFENRLVALLSFGLFTLLFIILGNIPLSIQVGTVHYYMPLLGLFFNFDASHLLFFNGLAFVVILLIFYFFIYKLVISRVSKKKILSIDTIQAIRGGETQ